MLKGVAFSQDLNSQENVGRTDWWQFQELQGKTKIVDKKSKRDWENLGEHICILKFFEVYFLFILAFPWSPWPS